MQINSTPVRFGQLYLDEASIRDVAGEKVLARFQQAKTDMYWTINELARHGLDIHVRGQQPSQFDNREGLWADVKDSYGSIVTDKSFSETKEIKAKPLNVLDNAIAKAFVKVIEDTGYRRKRLSDPA